jgi:arabinoxylan arabinofuranohydrolase
VTICQDEKVKVKMADVSKNNTSVVVASDDGAWVRYAGFAFGAAPKSVSALCRSKGSAVIEVRKGSVDGPIAATIALSDTNGEFRDFSAAVSGIGAETCDLYFVFVKSAAGTEFASYRFAR